MSFRRSAVLAFAATLVLSPGLAGAEDPRPVAPHIAAVQAFLIAWGHERWDDLREVSAAAVTVTVADRTFSVDPAMRSSEVAVRLPFRGLSTVREGTDVTGVTVDSLAVRIGEQEMRGTATVKVTEDAGQFRVLAVSMNAAQ